MVSQDLRTLKERVKAKAFELGFDLAGVTTLERTPYYAAYETWLDKGMQAGMDYLASDRGRTLRRNPQDLVPGAQCVLVLGMRYASRESHSVDDRVPQDGLCGRVASYARGHDYHDILREKAAALLAFLSKEAGPGVEGRVYTDTGPLLEREFAQKAGLGWQGKNTCLIHPVFGSYFFLTEIFLNIALEVDAPFDADRCGSCTRCLEACPTGCLLSGRVLDARRCLSYLTIENKGPIPADLRPALGDRIFGCDVCQQVCPWNRKSEEPVYRLDLVELFSFSAQDFNKRFKTSPIRRAKRRGLLRSAAIALGNRKDAAALPGLIQALTNESESLVRSHAAWALGCIGGQDAHEALSSALPKALADGDVDVIAEIQQALEVLNVH